MTMITMTVLRQSELQKKSEKGRAPDEMIYVGNVSSLLIHYGSSASGNDYDIRTMRPFNDRLER